MTDLTLSSLGLILLIVPVLIHGIEVLWPMQSRWIVNWVLPFFGPSLPKPSTSLSATEQAAMLDAARAATPPQKAQTSEDYLFLLLFEQRQGAIGFAAAAAGSFYGLGLGLADRDALHLVFGVVSILMLLVNANHAGVPGLGHHPRVSRNGKHVGMVFVPFWAVASVLNLLGFMAAQPSG